MASRTDKRQDNPGAEGDSDPQHLGIDHAGEHVHEQSREHPDQGEGDQQRDAADDQHHLAIGLEHARGTAAHRFENAHLAGLLGHQR